MEKPSGFDEVDRWSNRYDQYHSYLESETWSKLRNKRLLLDGFKCVICHNPNDLHVHHIIYPQVFGTETVNTLITVCKDCHSALEDFKKGYSIKHHMPQISTVLEIWIRFESKEQYESLRGEVMALTNMQNGVKITAFISSTHEKAYLGHATLDKYDALVSVMGADNVTLTTSDRY